MKRFTSVLFTAVMLFLAGCTQVTDLPENGGNSVGFNYTLTGLHSQRVAGTRAAVNVRAEMVITSHNTGQSETIPWYLSVDEEARTVVSNRTQVLEEGYYDFALTLVMGNHTYVGTAQNVNINADSNVALSVTPVIGDTTVNVDVTEIPQLKLSYPAAELTDIPEPKIGYIIDGGSEETVTLDKNTGLNAQYINLAPGAHTLKLNFYNGSVLIGESKAEQENITIVPGEDVKMDIIPLYSAMTTQITMDGGEAVFNFTIPSVVVEEAGGLNNLKALFKLTGKRNPYEEHLLTLTQVGSGYEASVTLPTYHYDDVVIGLEFSDGTDIIGSAVTPETALNSSARSLNLPLNLNRRAMISGNLQAVVGINVYDVDDNPVAGATVKANGKVVGITGSGTFGTPGFLSFFQTAGDVVISAEKEGITGEVSASVTPLGIRNFVVTLNNGSVYVVKAEGGAQHNMFLMSDGSLWSSGNNYYSQLGSGDNISSLTPVKILTSVKDYSTRYHHTMILKNDNTLWTVGFNEYGQLGDGSTINRNKPAQIMSDVSSISAGFHHSLVLKKDNTLWGSGHNAYGELGDGSTVNKYKFIPIAENVKSVKAGGYMSYYITNDNVLWGMGHNTYGQLSDKTYNHKTLPLPISSDVKRVIAGYYNVFVEKNDGSYWVAGHNTSGELGLGGVSHQNELKKVSYEILSIAAAHGTTYVLKNDHSLWGTGSNDSGQLGSGNTVSRGDWVKIADNVKRVERGLYHTAFIKNDNTVWVTGQNTSGQLGLGHKENQLTPVQIFK